MSGLDGNCASVRVADSVSLQPKVGSVRHVMCSHVVLREARSCRHTTRCWTR